MSPSKRLGGLVDPSAEHPMPVTERDDPAVATGNGNGSGNGHHAAGAVTTGRQKRTTLDPVSGSRAPKPQRGTSSVRGASSSTVTRRVAVTAPPRSLAPPRPPAQPRPPAPAKRAAQAPPTSKALDRVAPVPVPVVVPPSQPEPRPVDRVEIPVDQPPLLVGPSIAHEPPPPQASFTSHDIAPVPRVLGRRPRVRKVTRVVRHVDPWSVFKIAAVFNVVLYGVALTAGVLLWNVAYATGTIDNLERFFESFGWDTFEFHGGEIYHSLWVAGLFGVVGLTGAAVLAATLFNLITDLVGGVRFTVLEEEVVERTAAPMRRFVVRRPTADGDPSGPLAGPPTNLPARQPRPPAG
ncbi:MAG: DUF3566 domain-containing protein [Actinomycetota bacterium]|nr:DUF3566 domain-containing protein [Actinomycetota bacterium]